MRIRTALMCLASAAVGYALVTLWSMDSIMAVKGVAIGWLVSFFGCVIYLAATQRRRIWHAAQQQHHAGYVRGVGAMVLAYHEWYKTDSNDRLEVTMAAAEEGLVNWLDDWREPQAAELEKIKND